MLPRRARLFSTLALLTVAAVNAAGLWTITASRRAVTEEAARLFRAETDRRAATWKRGWPRRAPTSPSWPDPAW